MRLGSQALLCLSLILMIPGCAPSAASVSAPSPITPTVGSALPARTATLATTAAPATVPPQRPITVEPAQTSLQTFAFPSPAKLDQLVGYRLSLQIIFSGTQNGQPLQQKETYTLAYWREPRARLTTVETTEANGSKIQWLYGSVGDVHYWRSAPGQPCEVGWGKDMVVDEEIHPATLLPPADRGRDLGAETINAVLAEHYALSTASFGDTGGAAMEGDVWLARDGFVVKYNMRRRGGQEVFGTGIQGEQTYAYELNDVGSAKPLVLPEGCPAPATDLPALPDATDITRTPRGLVYTSPSGLDVVASFYTTQMAALGWELVADSDVVLTDARELEFERTQTHQRAFVSVAKKGSGAFIDAQTLPTD